MNKHATMRIHRQPRIIDTYGMGVRGFNINTDNRVRYQAQSILHGLVRDPLPDTAEQARDILAWYGRAYAREQSAPDTVISFANRRGF